MEAEYKIELADAVRRLQGSDDFRVVLDFIAQEKDAFLSDLRQAESPNDVMKIAGSLATLQELLKTLDARS